MGQGMGSLKWYSDISVLVAAAVTRHSHNAQALVVLEEPVKRKQNRYISAHSPSEVYSALFNFGLNQLGSFK